MWQDQRKSDIIDNLALSDEHIYFNNVLILLLTRNFDTNLLQNIVATYTTLSKVCIYKNRRSVVIEMYVF